MCQARREFINAKSVTTNDCESEYRTRIGCMPIRLQTKTNTQLANHRGSVLEMTETASASSPEVEKDREGAQAAKALDSVTDLVPEKQLDANRVKAAMEAMAAAQKADKEAQRRREKELAAVRIQGDHVDVIAGEFEVDKRAAERRLRECGGDVVAALKSFL